MPGFSIKIISAAQCFVKAAELHFKPPEAPASDPELCFLFSFASVSDLPAGKNKSGRTRYRISSPFKPPKSDLRPEKASWVGAER